MGTLQENRNSILTTIYGRRLGLDKNDFLIGKSAKHAIQALTSGSSATAITNYGVTAINVTTGSASTGSSIGTTEVGLSWNMDAPEPGVEKTIYLSNSTGSTAGAVVEFGTGVTGFNSSLGTTFTGILLQGHGAWVKLIGMSATSWMMVGMSTSTSMASSN